MWTIACQALLSMGFSRQGYHSGLTFHPPRNLPNPGEWENRIKCNGKYKLTSDKMNINTPKFMTFNADYFLC